MRNAYKILVGRHEVSYLVIDKSVTLKWILTETELQDMDWDHQFQDRILKTVMNLWFHLRQVIYRWAERLMLAPEGLCSMICNRMFYQTYSLVGSCYREWYWVGVLRPRR